MKERPILLRLHSPGFVPQGLWPFSQCFFNLCVIPVPDLSLLTFKDAAPWIITSDEKASIW